MNSEFLQVRLEGLYGTVLWDQKSTDYSDYLADVAGQSLDHIPLKEEVQ